MSKPVFPAPGMIESIVGSVDAALRDSGSAAVIGWMAIVETGTSFDLTINAAHDVTFGGASRVLPAVLTAIRRQAPDLLIRRGKPLLATGYIELRLSLTDDGFAVLNGSWDWGADCEGVHV